MSETVWDRLGDLGGELHESAAQFCEEKAVSGIAARALLAAFLAYTGVRYMAEIHWRMAND
jgi:hypothetical protein